MWLQDEAGGGTGLRVFRGEAAGSSRSELRRVDLLSGHGEPTEGFQAEERQSKGETSENQPHQIRPIEVKSGSCSLIGQGWLLGGGRPTMGLEAGLGCRWGLGWAVASPLPLPHLQLRSTALGAADG